MSTVGTMYTMFVYKSTCNYIIYYYYVQDWSGTGHELVWTITDSDWSCNCKKLCETAVDQSMTVPVSVFENLRNGGPVSVLVFSNMDEKLDWTVLPSAKWQEVSRVVLGSLVQSSFSSIFEKTETKTSLQRLADCKKLDWADGNWFRAVLVSFLLLTGWSWLVTVSTSHQLVWTSFCRYRM